MPDQNPQAPGLTPDMIYNNPELQKYPAPLRAQIVREIYNSAVRPQFAGKGSSPESIRSLQDWGLAPHTGDGVASNWDIAKTGARAAFDASPTGRVANYFGAGPQLDALTGTKHEEVPSLSGALRSIAEGQNNSPGDIMFPADAALQGRDISTDPGSLISGTAGALGAVAGTAPDLTVWKGLGQLGGAGLRAVGASPLPARLIGNMAAGGGMAAAPDVLEGRPLGQTLTDTALGVGFGALPDASALAHAGTEAAMGLAARSPLGRVAFDNIADGGIHAPQDVAGRFLALPPAPEPPRPTAPGIVEDAMQQNAFRDAARRAGYDPDAIQVPGNVAEPTRTPYRTPEPQPTPTREELAGMNPLERYEMVQQLFRQSQPPAPRRAVAGPEMNQPQPFQLPPNTNPRLYGPEELTDMHQQLDAQNRRTSPPAAIAPEAVPQAPAKPAPERYYGPEELTEMHDLLLKQARMPKPEATATVPEAPAPSSTTKGGQGVLEGMASYLENEGQAKLARARKNQNLSSFGAGQAELVAGHAQVLAARLLRGAVDFKTWAKEMVQEHGEPVIQHLKTIWEHGNELARAASENATQAPEAPDHGPASPLRTTTEAVTHPHLDALATRAARVEKVLARAKADNNPEAIAAASGKLRTLKQQAADLRAHLEANQAKAAEVASDYEAHGADQPLREKASGRINPDLAADDPAIAQVHQFFEDRYGNQLDHQKGGVRSLAKTAELADALGVDHNWLAQRHKDNPFTDAEVKRAKDIIATSAQNVKDLGAKVRGGTATPLDKVTFEKAVATHAHLLSQFLGGQTATARALSAFRLMGSVKADDLAALQKAMVESGGEDRINKLAAALGDKDGPALNVAVRKAMKKGWADKLMEWAINAALSGPTTHVANIVDNAAATALRLTDRVVAGGIGSVTGQKGVYAGEAAHMVYGMQAGIQEAAHAFMKVAKTGESEYAGQTPMDEHEPAIGGKAGYAIRTPTRLLEASDCFVKTLVYRGELQALAFRDAKAQGLSGDALTQHIVKTLENPTEAMLEKAHEAARYATFTSKMDGKGAFAVVDTVGNQIQAAKIRHPLLGLFAMFVKVPANAAKTTAEHTLLSALDPYFYRTIQAGIKAGASADEMAAMNMQAAKIVTGTAVMLAAIQQARAGNITGNGPSNWRDNKALVNSGWQPKSVYLNGSYVSYDKLGPLAGVVSLAADLATLDRTQGPKANALMGALVSTIKNLEDKTYFQSITQTILALSNPQRYLPGFAANMAASLLVPNLINKTAQATDGWPRDKTADTFSEQVSNAIKSRIPGLRQQLPKAQTVYGEPDERDMTALEQFASPFMRTVDKKDPVLDELARIKYDHEQPKTYKMDDGAKVPLTKDLQRKMLSASSPFVKEALSGLLQDPDYLAMDDQERKAFVAKLFTEAYKNDAFRTAFENANREKLTQLAATAQKQKLQVGHAPGLKMGSQVQQATPNSNTGPLASVYDASLQDSMRKGAAAPF